MKINDYFEGLETSHYRSGFEMWEDVLINILLKMERMLKNEAMFHTHIFIVRLKVFQMKARL